MQKIVPFSERRDERQLQRMREELPPADTRRWVASRKAAVVAAVEAGAITEAEALRRYDLSADELGLWRESLARHGPSALLVTKLQHFRNTHDE